MSSNGTTTSTSDQPSPTAASTPPAQPESPSPSLTESSSAVASPTPQPPTSSPVDITSSPAPPPSSTPEPPSTSDQTSDQPSNSPPPNTTRTTTASTRPPTTQTITSVITPSPTSAGEIPTPVTVIHTSTSPGETIIYTDGASPSPSAPTVSDPAVLQSPGASKSPGGLSGGGKTAIAVVVPVVVVALLVIGGILLWRRRKSKMNDAEARRKEVEEYGFNPNNDPTLPAVAMTSEMAEDHSGYRGWGNTTTSSHAKGSTTLASANTYSDSNSNPGGYQSPGSPTQGTYSDGHSADPLVHNRRETLDSDGIGALGAAPVANNQAGVHRGPSNASSSYSAADRSDNSGDYPIPVNNPQEYYDHNNNGYYHATSPYDNNPYAGQPQQPQPIIRDVSARRNTRIENPSIFPQQGNSGIAQNF